MAMRIQPGGWPHVTGRESEHFFTIFSESWILWLETGYPPGVSKCGNETYWRTLSRNCPHIRTLWIFSSFRSLHTSCWESVNERMYLNSPWLCGPAWLKHGCFDMSHWPCPALQVRIDLVTWLDWLDMIDTLIYPFKERWGWRKTTDFEAEFQSQCGTWIQRIFIIVLPEIPTVHLGRARTTAHVCCQDGECWAKWPLEVPVKRMPINIEVLIRHLYNYLVGGRASPWKLCLSLWIIIPDVIKKTWLNILNIS